MRMKFVLATALLLAATQAQAGLTDFIKSKIKQAVESGREAEQPTGTPPSASAPSPQMAAPAPAEPERDPAITDRFVTRKDAHGHDYDAMTGLLICLAKPRNYKDGAYAASFSQTSIPEGHNPHGSCITADREYTKM